MRITPLLDPYQISIQFFFFTFVRASLLIVYTTSKTHRISNIYSQSVIHEYFPTLLQNVLHIDTWIRLLFMVLITWAYFLLVLKWLFIIHFLFLKLLRMVKKTGTYMNILLLSFIYLFILCWVLIFGFLPRIVLALALPPNII